MHVESVEVLTVKVPTIHRPGAHAEAPRTYGTSAYLIEPSWRHLYSLDFQTCFVKLTTNTGLVGWGEAQAPIAAEVTAALISNVLGHLVLGENPAQNELLFARMYHGQNVRGHVTGYYLDAIAAVDIALWDLKAQAYNAPLFEVLGGPFRTELAAYGSDLQGSTREERVANARRYTQELGLSGVKLYLGRGLAHDIEEAEAIRDAIGPDKELYCDCLWRYDLSSAIRLGRALDRLRAGFMEAPLQPEDRAGHAALAHAIDTPIAVGEPLRHATQFLDWFKDRGLDVAQPDILRTGITGGKKIIDLAETFNIPVALHFGMSLGIGIAATWHVAAAMDNFLVQERQVRQAEVIGDMVQPALEMRDGQLLVPQRPGLGVALDEDAIAPHVVDRTVLTRGA
ncbi:MAG: mandelate racemase/muconate lactonizing enzyme family protein [Chloroflexia bacterium]|nr:mandelate racemase/muconate lactonizing enzyme family protein [Chloroflexia bacterium]